MIKSTILSQPAKDDPEVWQRQVQLIPLKQAAEPQEIDQAAIFLASKDGKYMHGTTLLVDECKTWVKVSEIKAQSRQTITTKNLEWRDLVMKYDEFIIHVQSTAQLDSPQAAEQAARATLETIAERIVGDEASQLAAQLPPELGQCLRGHEGENGHPFSLQEFYQRVSQKAGVDPVTAAVQTRAVFTVLTQAVTPEEFAEVKANFSDDYSELFAIQGKA